LIEDRLNQTAVNADTSSGGGAQQMANTGHGVSPL